MAVTDHLAQVIEERPDEWTGSPQLLADLARDLLAARKRCEQAEATLRSALAAGRRWSHSLAGVHSSLDDLRLPEGHAGLASLTATCDEIRRWVREGHLTR